MRRAASMTVCAALLMLCYCCMFIVSDMHIAHLRNTPLRHSERETLITLAFDLEGISKHEGSKYQECL